MNDLNKIQQEFMARLQEVEMDVTVRFGMTEMALRDVAALGSGSMLELNRTVDEPVELLINGSPFARGEVVVVDGYYSVRVTEVSPAEKNSNTFLVDAFGAMNSEATPAPHTTGNSAPKEPAPNSPQAQTQPAAAPQVSAQKPAPPPAQVATDVPSKQQPPQAPQIPPQKPQGAA